MIDSKLFGGFAFRQTDKWTLGVEESRLKIYKKVQLRGSFDSYTIASICTWYCFHMDVILNYIHCKNFSYHVIFLDFTVSFQSRKRLYNSQCPFVRSFVCLLSKPPNSFKSIISPCHNLHHHLHHHPQHHRHL